MDESLSITMTPAMKETLDRLMKTIPTTRKKSFDYDFGDRRVVHWPISDEYEWQTNIGNSEAYRWEQRGFVISTPKATPQCSVEDLLKMNLSGVYLHKPTSIKGVWPILMPRQPMFFPDEDFIEYMPIPKSLPSLKNFDFEKIKKIDFSALLKKKEEGSDE